MKSRLITIVLFSMASAAGTMAQGQGNDAEAVRRASVATQLRAAERDLMQWDQQLAELSRKSSPDDPRLIEAQRQRTRAQQRVLQLNGEMTGIDRSVNPSTATQIEGAQREVQSWDRKLQELNSQPGPNQDAQRAEYMRQRQNAAQRLARLQGQFAQDQNQRVEDPVDLTNRQSLLTQIAGAQREIQSWDRQMLELERKSTSPANDAAGAALDRRAEAAKRNLALYQKQLAELDRRGADASATERQRIERNIAEAQRDLQSAAVKTASNDRYRAQNSQRSREEILRNRNRAQQRLNLLQQKLRELDARK